VNLCVATHRGEDFVAWRAAWRVNLRAPGELGSPYAVEVAGSVS